MAICLLWKIVYWKAALLGLIPADELPQIQAQLQRLAKQAEETIDIDGLLALANTANEIADSHSRSASCDNK
mgnify:CR=1 FL=1